MFNSDSFYESFCPSVTVNILLDSASVCFIVFATERSLKLGTSWLNVTLLSLNPLLHVDRYSVTRPRSRGPISTIFGMARHPKTTANISSFHIHIFSYVMAVTDTQIPSFIIQPSSLQKACSPFELYLQIPIQHDRSTTYTPHGTPPVRVFFSFCRIASHTH